MLGRSLGIAPADVAGLVPATTTTGLALAMGEGMPLANQELIPLGPMVCGLTGMVLFPVYARITGMAGKSHFHRGFALGSVAHVSVMAGLLAAGQQEAAEAAALAFFLFGTFRALLVKVQPFNGLLMRCCGFESAAEE